MGNPLQSLGLAGGSKGSVQADVYNPAQDQLNRRASIWTNPYVNQAMKDYYTGAIGQDEAVNLQGNSFIPAAYYNALATSALTGSKWATDEVRKNAILGQLFGKGGQLEQQLAREQELQNKGFKLTPEDREAYGQASGDIARLYGQQEAALAQSLANRGLAAAPSGAAGAGFSGLMGNKNEQLAKAQLSIADARMANTLNRLNQTQNYITALGGQAQSAIDQQYQRQLAGQQAEMANLQGTAAGQVAQNRAANEGNLAAAQFNAANQNKTLFDALGAGLFQGVQSGVGGAVSSGIGSIPQSQTVSQSYKKTPTGSQTTTQMGGSGLLGGLFGGGSILSY